MIINDGKALLCLAFLLCVVLFPQKLFAAQVTDLYEVSVESQSEADREKAFKQALADVVVKVTGQPSSLSSPALQKALHGAKDYIQSFSYQKQMMDGVEQRVLHVNFDKKAVNRLLRSSDLGIWGTNRPDTLLWLAIDHNGSRSILVDDGDSPLTSELKSAMQARALPMTLPLMDFEDSNAISIVDVWGLFTSSLQQASARYGSEAIVAGRLSENAGLYTGRMMLLFRNQRFGVDIQRLDGRQLAHAIVDLTGQSLARYYAVHSTAEHDNPVLEIDNVNSTESYASVIQYLDSLTAVRDVMVINVNGSRLMLELNIDGTLSQLSDAIAFGRQLKPVGNESVDQRLNYLWMGQ